MRASKLGVANTQVDLESQPVFSEEDHLFDERGMLEVWWRKDSHGAGKNTLVTSQILPYVIDIHKDVIYNAKHFQSWVVSPIKMRPRYLLHR